MVRHTHYLDVLVLLCTLAPAELVRIATSFRVQGVDEQKKYRRLNVGVPLSYASVAALGFALIYSLQGVSADLVMTSTVKVFSIAVLSGLGIFAIEIVVATLPSFLRGRRVQFRVNLGGSPPDVALLLSILFVGAVEEFLYRGIWLNVGVIALGFPKFVAVFLAAAAYAGGHLFFGVQVVTQKLISGILFGVLAVATGTVLAPICAHLALNVCVIALARSKRIATV